MTNLLHEFLALWDLLEGNQKAKIAEDRAIAARRARDKAEEDVRARAEAAIRNADYAAKQARYAAERAESAREDRRHTLYSRNPDLQRAWFDRINDRFAPEPDDDSYTIEPLPGRSFRGPTLALMTNTTRGGTLRMIGGDVADNEYGLALTMPGRSEQKFNLWRGHGAGEPDPVETGVVGGEVDDEGMRAVSRFFNARPTLSLFADLPVVLYRLKPRYWGKAGDAAERADRALFLDACLDAEDAASGADHQERKEHQ